MLIINENIDFMKNINTLWNFNKNLTFIFSNFSCVVYSTVLTVKSIHFK